MISIYNRQLPELLPAFISLYEYCYPHCSGATAKLRNAFRWWIKVKLLLEKLAVSFYKLYSCHGEFENGNDMLPSFVVFLPNSAKRSCAISMLAPGKEMSLYRSIQYNILQPERLPWHLKAARHGYQDLAIADETGRQHTSLVFLSSIYRFI